MVIRRLLPVLALAGVLAVAGCARPDDGPQPGAAPPSAPASVPASTAPTPLDPVGPSAKPPVVGEAQTLTGTVVAGVEPRCVVLRTASGDYLLLTSGAAPKAGATVTAIGTVDKNKVTTCMQGIPFVVTEIRAG